MPQPLKEQTPPVKDPDGWARLRSALPVAAAWTGLAALVELLITFVLAPQLPASVHFFIVYGRSYMPDARIGTEILILIAWIGIAVCAVVVGAGFMVKRQEAVWPMAVGVFLSAAIPFVMSANLVSILFQLGHATPIPPLSVGANTVVFIANITFLVIGAASVLVVSSRRKVRA